jgi:predicted nucleic acid-binding protein
MVAVDNTFLSLLLHPKAKPPLDPTTKKPLARVEDRIDLLIEDLELAGDQILIPTPVLSEFLILADNDGPTYLAEISTNRLFTIGDYDTKASIELAAMNLEIRRGKSGSAKRRGDAQGTWAKIQFDRQIVAIAKVNDVSVIYSDDDGVEKFAKKQLIAVVRSWELPLPTAKQIPLLPTEEPKPKARRAIAQHSEET